MKKLRSILWLLYFVTIGISVIILIYHIVCHYTDNTTEDAAPLPISTDAMAYSDEIIKTRTNLFNNQCPITLSNHLAIITKSLYDGATVRDYAIVTMDAPKETILNSMRKSEQISQLHVFLVWEGGDSLYMNALIDHKCDIVSILQFKDGTTDSIRTTADELFKAREYVRQHRQEATNQYVHGQIETLNSQLPMDDDGVICQSVMIKGNNIVIEFEVDPETWRLIQSDTTTMKENFWGYLRHPAQTPLIESSRLGKLGIIFHFKHSQSDLSLAYPYDTLIADPYLKQFKQLYLRH